jgi:two-component system, LuxR family, response regulator FixJ
MPGERIVHVLDDDTVVRRSLERLLDSAGFRPVLHDAPEAFLNAVRDSSEGCALLDVYMPVMDGFEVQARLQEQGSRLPVIVMTGHGDVPVVVRAMKAGAVDFIEKPFDDQMLLDAIELALTRSGRSDRHDAIAEAVQRVARLSVREREVLAALVSGKPNKVIAFDLGISVRTVEVHRGRMMERLGVRQIGEAVRLAVLASLSV